MWHITDKDGLPSMTVYHINQDRFGNIWLGTEKGICRFDGKVFKTYKSPELSDSDILKVEIDHLDRIWFSNLSGQLFYIKEDKIHNAQSLLPSEKHSVFDFKIFKNSLWVSVKSINQSIKKYNLTRIDFDTLGGFSSPTLYKEQFSGVTPFAIKDQSIYILGDHVIKKSSFLIQFKKESDHWIKSRITQFNKIQFGKSLYFKDQEIYAISNEQQNGHIQQIIDGKLTSFFKPKKKTTINNLFYFDQQFWICSKRGIFIKDDQNRSQSEHPSILKESTCNYILVDHEGNKWIATTGKGIYVINAAQTQVFQKHNFPLPNNEIYSLAYDQSNDKLILGHSKSILSLIDKDLNHKTLKLNSAGRINQVLIDSKGNYWCIGESNLIVLTDKLKFEWEYLSYYKKVFETSQGDFWFGAPWNAFRIEKSKIKNPLSFQISQTREEFINKKTYALQEDFSKTIWIGTIQGVYFFKDSIFPFLENGKQFPYNVACMERGVDSTIWVGTRGNGLIGIKNNQVISRFDQTNGLMSNTIKCLSITEQHIWVGTDNGVSKFDVQTQSWEWINTADGLPTNDITDIIIARDQVWIATLKGLVQFSINAKHTNRTPPPIYISNIKIEERDTLLLNSFSLPYHQNNLHIDFVGVGYKGKGLISYQYKLSGLESKWVNTDSRYVRYPNLAPGDYSFEVYAINEDQTRSISPAKVQFSIHPPWWKTWWFISLSILTILSILALGITAKVRQQKREQFFVTHLNELKNKALRSQMNPHFIFNALNSIQKFLTTNDREKAMYYLSRFAKLIRLIFEFSQHERISLEEEIEFLELYLDLEKLRFMETIDIQFVIVPELLDISDELNVPPLLIQPIIENSFKHGFLYKKELGLLKINFSRDDSYLVCTIEDNGIGRKEAAKLGQRPSKDRPSSGLKTAKERLTLLGQPKNNSQSTSNFEVVDLLDPNGETRGTLVRLKIYCPELEKQENDDD